MANILMLYFFAQASVLCQFKYYLNIYTISGRHSLSPPPFLLHHPSLAIAGLGASGRRGGTGCVLARSQSGGGELCLPAVVPPPAS